MALDEHAASGVSRFTRHETFHRISRRGATSIRVFRLCVRSHRAGCHRSSDLVLPIVHRRPRCWGGGCRDFMVGFCGHHCTRGSAQSHHRGFTRRLSHLVSCPRLGISRSICMTRPTGAGEAFCVPLSRSTSLAPRGSAGSFGGSESMMPRIYANAAKRCCSSSSTLSGAGSRKVCEISARTVSPKRLRSR